MLETLKRTTAIAALAALPFSGAAIAQSQTGQQAEEAQQTQSGQQSAGQAQGAGSSQQVQGAATGSGQQTGGQSQNAGSGQQAQGAGSSEQAQKAATGSGQQIDGQSQNAGSGQQAQGSTSGSGQQAGTGNTAGAEGQNAQSSMTSGSEPAQQQAGEAGEDVLIATVGDAEIRRSDVLDAIAQLPPQLQQQPAEMLIPLAVDQLVTRHLILDEARAAKLDEDPEVTALAPNNATETARENAMVQVWLDRQLKDRVTDQKVRETYDAVKAQFGDETPEMEQLRPQIENQLRQEAFAEISSNLQTDAEITVYGPDGQPLEPTSPATTQ